MYYRICLLLLLTTLVAGCAAPGGAAPTAVPTVPAPTPTSVPPTQLPTPSPVPTMAALQGEVIIDGSSTVFPVTEAAALGFRMVAPDVQLRIGVSGTGGGFRKFCTGETTISGASRPISQAEIAACAAAGIEFIELPVAFDGISVVVHPSNTWAICVTVDELRAMWEPASEKTITQWSQVRAGWPEEGFSLYGAGAESGTYDYFTQAIVGEEGVSRSDYIGSEDDYLLAQDISADPAGIGFFGFTYYREYADQLRLVAIENNGECVEPSLETIADGRYQPLSRPVFIYLRADKRDDPAVRSFVEYYLQNGPMLVNTAGAIPLPERAYELALARVERGITGSVFSGGSQIGVSIETLLELEGD